VTIIDMDNEYAEYKCSVYKNKNADSDKVAVVCHIFLPRCVIKHKIYKSNQELIAYQELLDKFKVQDNKGRRNIDIDGKNKNRAGPSGSVEISKILISGYKTINMKDWIRVEYEYKNRFV